MMRILQNELNQALANNDEHLSSLIRIVDVKTYYLYQNSHDVKAQFPLYRMF